MSKLMLSVLSVLLMCLALAPAGCQKTPTSEAEETTIRPVVDPVVGVKWTPPWMPFSITVDSNCEITVALDALEKRIATPIGVFALQTNVVIKPLEGYQQEILPFEPTPGYTHLIIRHRGKGNDTVYRLRSGDSQVVCEAEGGKTVIRASNNCVVIDVTESTTYKVWCDQPEAERAAINSANPKATARTFDDLFPDWQPDHYLSKAKGRLLVTVPAGFHIFVGEEGNPVWRRVFDGPGVILLKAFGGDAPPRAIKICFAKNAENPDADSLRSSTRSIEFLKIKDAG